VKKILKQPGFNRKAGVVLICALAAGPLTAAAQSVVESAVPSPVQSPVPSVVQTNDALGWQGKLEFHGHNIYGPFALVGDLAYAGFLQETNSPKEWGQGFDAYGKRLASASAASAIHGVLAFGLDSALHQDPRYYRSGATGFWRRSGHALRGTILTRTDAGAETLSTWRIGSAYGTAFLSDLWYPDRLDTLHEGLIQGSLRLGFDLVSNLGAEFWPDIKAKIFHRKPRP
jgi:hypothetical protein